MPRMQILSAAEQRAFETPPQLNSTQRKSVFDLPGAFQKEAASLRDPAHQIGFLINAGYFRCARRFFDPADFEERDIALVASKLGYDRSVFSVDAYPDRMRQRQSRTIERLSGFRPLGAEDEITMQQLIDRGVQTNEKPKTIFISALDRLAALKIVAPSYSRLQGLILNSISSHRAHQSALVEKHLSSDLRKELDALMEEEETSEGDRFYRLTALKRHSQSVKPFAVKARLANHAQLLALFQKVEPIIAVLAWDQNSLQSYAAAVIKYDLHDLRRRKDTDRYLHLIAFVAYQFYTLQDNLVATLLNSVKAAENTASREHKDWCYAERKSLASKLQARIEAFEDHFKTAMGQLLQVFDSTELSDSDKLASLRLMLFSTDTPPVLSDNILKGMKDVVASPNKDDAQYFTILEAQSRALQNRVSGLLKSLIFTPESNSKPLFTAIKNYQKTQGNITKSAPVAFLAPAERIAVGEGAAFRPSLYKILLFQHVSDAIKSGSVNLPQSQKYRAFDGYMIEVDVWKRDREELLKQAGMEGFSDPEAVQKELRAALDQQFLLTNDNIANGKNVHVRHLASGKIRVVTPKLEEVAAPAMMPYLPQRHFVPLTEILGTVNAATAFANDLSHLKRQYARQTSRAVLFAGVIGMGCGIGLRKMARISSTISEDALDHTATWHLSYDNLLAANDRIVAFTNGLDLPEIYRRQEGLTHTASDGQKFEVAEDSLGASYSFKYFGSKQGISIYTFTDSKGLLWYSTGFSAADRESGYVIDGLMHNDVVKSDVHSTDTHGFSEAIFCVTHLLGIAFAPRIKNLKRQTLYGFRSTGNDNRKNGALQANKYIDEAIIREHWEDILRLLVTIKLKKTTASDIFRRLNSYSKQNSLYTALKAFGRITKTLFILRYIDEVDLRMSIEGMLNKIELANRFTRAVAVGSPREFISGIPEDQKIAEACNRLIKNAIICWNYLYLEMRLRNADSAQRAILLQAIRAHSPLSWAHINLLGEYDFSDEKLADSFGILPPKMAA